MRQRDGYRRSRPSRWQPNDRQRLVLDALTENKTNQEIAALLGVTLDGAKWHVSELLSLTGLDDRQALAAWWVRERDLRPSLLMNPLLLRLSLLALGVGVAVVAGGLLLTSGSARKASPARTDPPAALGLDLPKTPSFTPTATPPVPAAYYACPVTKPKGNAPPHHIPGPWSHGDGTLWTNLGPDGRYVFGGIDLPQDGSLYVKWIWWASTPGGQLAFEAERLDGPGAVSSATFVPAGDGSGVPGWVGGPVFSSPGCWQITATLGGHSLTLVVFLQVLR